MNAWQLLRRVCAPPFSGPRCHPVSLTAPALLNLKRRLCTSLIRQENAKQESSFEDEFAEREPQKTLKIAVIGLPNSGKSTLINQIIERRVRFDYNIIFKLDWPNKILCFLKVCATSMKVHTTTNTARAINNSGNTQLIFLDTPGLVTRADMKKYGFLKIKLSENNNDVHKYIDMLSTHHLQRRLWSPSKKLI